MKKIWTSAIALLFVLVLAACGSSEEDSSSGEGSSEEGSKEITVGATSVPHAEVLEEAKPLLEEEGITLNIEEYQDYILPNQDLAEGRIDANYFQTIPYMELQEKDNDDYDFANLGGIHIEPIGVYSQKYENLEDIEDGTEFVMSRSVSTHGRVLTLLEKEGLIKLDESVEKVDATVNDIVENPKNLQFDTGVDAANLPEVYKKEEEVLVAINTNYAIEADLVPKEDAIILEGTNSPYVNVIAAQSKDEGSEALNTLVEVLRSEDIQTFIEEEYDGAVIPVSGDSE
ncbi:methionine ABC transporter substrate-binding protein [Halobacillus kuroshimensis]|uniref:Lipoprotein n=1 Tax=Halobacillus kuroshimensis TaxID=302481 RepID=A0ABS3DW83_9BACI|nr:MULTISPECIES: MetQ/NlpA family ABC transporter substrate-binding protein [Halobacillus]MBN8235493.1 methionine ABC transporter substrate-binding protein [Halobacillus kuroshimensis]